LTSHSSLMSYLSVIYPTCYLFLYLIVTFFWGVPWVWWIFFSIVASIVEKGQSNGKLHKKSFKQLRSTLHVISIQEHFIL
jgi:hypothetical protein